MHHRDLVGIRTVGQTNIAGYEHSFWGRWEIRTTFLCYWPSIDHALWWIQVGVSITSCYEWTLRVSLLSVGRIVGQGIQRLEVSTQPPRITAGDTTANPESHSVAITMPNNSIEGRGPDVVFSSPPRHPSHSRNPLHPFTPSELSNVFSASLDPDTFAALVASGMLPFPHSQQHHPASESLRNPYAVQQSPFLSTPTPHIVDGQYSKLPTYSHTIPGSGPQIKSKQTIVREIACFLSSHLYFPPRRSSNLIRRSLKHMFRTTSMLTPLRCRIDLSTVGLLTVPPLSLPTTSSHLLMGPTTTPSAPTLGYLLPCGCLLLRLFHLPPGTPTRCHTIL